MQLDKVDIGDIVRPSCFLYVGEQLALCIDRPPLNSDVFNNHLSNNEKLFPKLAAAFHESRKQLNQRSKEDRVYLKENLLEDMKTNVAQANAALGCDKRLGDEVISPNPDEGILFVEKKTDEIFDEIVNLKIMVQTMNRARDVLERMQRSKRELEAFNESIYTSSPAEPEPRPLLSKKAKTG